MFVFQDIKQNFRIIFIFMLNIRSFKNISSDWIKNFLFFISEGSYCSILDERIRIQISTWFQNIDQPVCKAFPVQVLVAHNNSRKYYFMEISMTFIKLDLYVPRQEVTNSIAGQVYKTWHTDDEQENP